MSNAPVIIPRRTHRKPLRRLFTAALVLLFGGTGFASGKIDPLLTAIPEYSFEKLEEVISLSGRQQLGPFSTEILREYDLKGYSRWYVHHADLPQPIEMEVYQLLDSAAAYGIFTMWNSGSELGRDHRLDLEVENHYEPGKLTFWRGHFFVNLQGIGEEPPSRHDFQALGTSMVSGIRLPNAYPLTFTQMPSEAKVESSVRFYLGPAALSLNPAFPEGLIPFIGFNYGAEITFAHYGDEKGSLFLVGYPTPSLAVDHAASLEEALHTQIPENEAYIKRSGFLVALFFGQEEQAQQVLALVNYSPEIKWVYDKHERRAAVPPEEDLVPFLLKLLIGILIALGIAGVIGLVIGIVRFLVLRRYPDLGYYDKMVRLKIDDHEGRPERDSDPSVPSGPGGR
jgi:hypothetical protein